MGQRIPRNLQTKNARIHGQCDITIFSKYLGYMHGGHFGKLTSTYPHLLLLPPPPARQLKSEGKCLSFKTHSYHTLYSTTSKTLTLTLISSSSTPPPLPKTLTLTLTRNPSVSPSPPLPIPTKTLTLTLIPTPNPAAVSVPNPPPLKTPATSPTRSSLRRSLASPAADGGARR